MSNSTNFTKIASFRENKKILLLISRKDAIFVKNRGNENVPKYCNYDKK